MELINRFFESYLTLIESEEKELMEEIKQLDREESEKILKLPNSWVEKGKKEGIQEGELKGIRKVALIYTVLFLRRSTLMMIISILFIWMERSGLMIVSLHRMIALVIPMQLKWRLAK
jgi:hypothetical protein